MASLSFFTRPTSMDRRPVRKTNGHNERLNSYSLRYTVVIETQGYNGVDSQDPRPTLTLSIIEPGASFMHFLTPNAGHVF